MLGVLQDGQNSVKRFYLNNFKDGYRQGAIDAIMCKDISDYVNEEGKVWTSRHDSGRAHKHCRTKKRSKLSMRPVRA